MLTVEELTDEELDRIVELANEQWNTRLKLPHDPDRLTPLMTCHIIRAYLTVTQQQVRPKLVWFVHIMEEKLQQNDHKGGWSECSLLWLMNKLNEEVGELSEQVGPMYLPGGQEIGGDYLDAQILEREAADVANLAMMIADRAGEICVVDPDVKIDGEDDDIAE